MLVGILQCGHFPQAAGFPPRTYTDLYSDMLAGRGLTFRTWNVVDDEFPDSVDEAQGWLITGSKHGAYDALPFIARLEDFIRDAYAAGVPQVGICFGHQIIAQALGGTVEKFDGGWSVGRKVYSFEDRTMALTAWHQDQVIVPPPGARTIASSDMCTHAAFVYEGPVFSVQPHPEFDLQAVELLLEARSDLLPKDIVDCAAAAKDLPSDNAVMADRIAAFFKEARA